MSVDWVRVYQDPDNINVGCDPAGSPTADYISRHMEAYTNPNMTLWGNTPEEGGYGQEWPLNRLYSKGCKGTRTIYPGDPDLAERVAPVLATGQVTPGTYTSSGKQAVVAKHTPRPGEPFSTPQVKDENAP